MPDLEAAAALREARGLLANGWIKGTWHKRTYKGFFNSLFKYNPDDVYCAMGAVGTASHSLVTLRRRMENFLEEALPQPFRYIGVIAYNDFQSTSKEDVLALFDRAAIIAEGTEKPEPEKEKIDPFTSIKYSFFTFEPPLISQFTKPPISQFMSKNEFVNELNVSGEYDPPKEIVPPEPFNIEKEVREYVNSLKEGAAI